MTINVHQMLAKTAAKVMGETSPLFTTASREGENEFGKVVNNHKSGTTINVGIPALGTVVDGKTVSHAAPSEGQKPLTLNIRKNISFDITAIENATDVDSIERFVKQYAAQLAQYAHNAAMEQLFPQVSNTIYTGSGSAADQWFDAGALLDEGHAPSVDRYALVSGRTHAVISKALSNQWDASSETSRKSTIGMHAGFEFNKANGLPSYVAGNKVTGVQANAAPTAGSSTLVLKGLTSGDTFIKGQAFTIGGVYAVNPLSGATTPELQQFVFTDNFTASGATLTTTVFPAFVVGKTVSALPAANAPLEFVGTASLVMRQGLGFNKDAIRVAFADIPVPSDKDGYQYKNKGFSLTVTTGSDIDTLDSTTRLDLCMGVVLVRPEWAVKVLG